MGREGGACQLEYTTCEQLRLPYFAVDDEEEEEEEEGPRPSSALDSFDEVYKPLELTDFDGLFSRNITRTSE